MSNESDVTIAERRRRRHVGWLIAANVAVTFGAYSIERDFATVPLTAQVALMAAWLIVGRTHWLSRLLSCGVFVLACYLVSDLPDNWRVDNSIRIALMLSAPTVMGGLLCQRLGGARLHWSADGSLPAPRPRWQFSIRQMMSWTLAAALLVAAGQWCYSEYVRLGDGFTVFFFVLFCWIGFGVGFHTLAVFWMAFTPGPIKRHAALVILFTIGLFVLGRWISRADGEYYTLAFIGFCTPAFANLLIVRRAGYRFGPDGPRPDA